MSLGLFRCIALLTVAGPALAETPEWQPPALVPDNPVLSIALGSHTTRDGKALFAWLGYDPDSYHPGTVEFRESLIRDDAEGLIGDARPTDGVGMSYLIPFSAHFPMPAEVERLQNAIGPVFLSDWNDPATRVQFHFNTELDTNAQAEMVMIFFKLNFDAGEEPGACHARQVITILYTGEVDEAALAACLDAEVTQ